MKEAMYEIIVTVLILILVGVGITLARTDVEIVQKLAQSSNEFEKISTDDFVNVERNTVIGGDVISFIRYFSNNSNVTIEVTAGGSTRSYVDETYNSSQFNIPYDMEFNNQVVYNGSQLEKIICIQK
ncbi:hypothetical protein [Wukongibacter sp. M2B1]|uniref:hypothetical protein n=1 Tax=Wukongibacter sp. M2B1 TaxID=3088895 RepID=UPI003D7949B0